MDYIIPKGVETRKNWSVEKEWSVMNKDTKIEELKNFDFSTAKETLHETSKYVEIEGKLLRNFNRNRALRMERAKIVSLVKISEFWIKNMIKRGEALELLDRVLSKFEPLKAVDLRIIPELNIAFQIRNKLRLQRIDFTKDDYYLTYEEQIQKQLERYAKLFRDPNSSGFMKNMFAFYDNIKDSVESQCVSTGDSINHFSFQDEDENVIDTRELLKTGPLVLSFFRGSWCPYCVNEMCVLNDSLPRIKALGANFVSLSPDITALKYFRKLGVVGMIGLDKDMGISKNFRLLFPIKTDHREAYIKAGVDLGKFNSGGEWFLPVPATYIFDKSGKIVYSFAKIEYYKRLDPRVIVQVLSDLFEQEVNDEHETILGKRKWKDIDPEKVPERVSKKIKMFDHSDQFSSPIRKK